MNRFELCKFSELEDRQPIHALVKDLDLVIIRYDNDVSVLYGRCLHRGALMADGHVEGGNLICGVHGWDYRYDTGVSEYNNNEVLHKFTTLLEGDVLYVDLDEIQAFLLENPQSFNRDTYQGSYADTHPEETEPYTGYIGELAKNGLKNIGHHGFTEAMGVDRTTLPKWEEIQFLPAQLSRRPLLDQAKVSSKVIIGKRAKKPLELEIPIFVSDMSFGGFVKGSKNSPGQRSREVRNRNCQWRGGNVARRTGKQFPLFLRIGFGKIRILLG